MKRTAEHPGRRLKSETGMARLDLLPPRRSQTSRTLQGNKITDILVLLATKHMTVLQQVSDSNTGTRQSRVWICDWGLLVFRI